MKTLFAVALVALVGCDRAQEAAPAAPTAPAAVTHAPTCAMSMSAPQAVEGANFFGTGTLTDCTETDWDGVLQVRVNAGGLIVGVDVDRTQAAPGNTLDIGWQAAAFVPGYDACVGTVTWTSDEPDWSLTVNAVCGDKDLVATFHGHVYRGNN